MGKALDIDWNAARRAIELGASYEQVAATFGVGHATIRKRALRHGWLTPEKAHEAVVSGITIKRHDPAKATAMVTEALGMTWQQKGEAHRNLVFDIAHNAIKKAKMPAPVKWAELDIADKLARKAAGLESGESQVNIAILPNGWPKPASENGGWSGHSVDTNVVESEEPSEALASEGSEG
jgi:hypothetical protein